MSINKILTLFVLSLILLACEMSEVVQLDGEKLQQANKYNQKICNTSLTSKYNNLSDYFAVHGELTLKGTHYPDGTYIKEYVLLDNDKELMTFRFDDPSISKLPKDMYLQLLVSKTTNQLFSSSGVTQSIQIDPYKCEEVDQIQPARFSLNQSHGTYRIGLFYKEHYGETSDDDPERLEQIADKQNIVDNIKKFFDKSFYNKVNLDIKVFKSPNYTGNFQEDVYAFVEKNKSYFNLDIKATIEVVENGTSYSLGDKVVLQSDGLWTIIHELSHSFGLDHSDSALGYNADLSRRGDYTNIMGFAPSFDTKTTPRPAEWANFPNVESQTFSGQQRYALDIHNAQTFKATSKTAKYFFVDIDKSDSSSIIDKTQVVEATRVMSFNGSSKDVYIYLSLQNGALLIHKSGKNANRVKSNWEGIRMGAAGGSILIGDLRKGSEGRFEGMQVEYKDYVAGVAEVNVYTDPRDPEPNEPNPVDTSIYSCNKSELGDQIKAYRLVLCPGDADNLSQNTSPKFVSSCSTPAAIRKCEYICPEGTKYEKTPTMNDARCIANPGLEDNSCQEGYQLSSDGTRCELIPVSSQDIEINLYRITKTALGSTKYERETDFVMKKDEIRYEVLHAGEDAKACLEYFNLPSGARFRGCANTDPETSDAWKSMKTESSEWNFSQEKWILKTDLKEPTYLEVGDYIIYWYNPTTGKKKMQQYSISRTDDLL